MIPDVPMSTILPKSVRDSLVRASQVESRIDPGESDERAAAVDAVVAVARANHPQYFQKEV